MEDESLTFHLVLAGVGTAGGVGPARLSAPAAERSSARAARRLPASAQKTLTLSPPTRRPTPQPVSGAPRRPASAAKLPTPVKGHGKNPNSNRLRKTGWGRQKTCGKKPYPFLEFATAEKQGFEILIRRRAVTLRNKVSTCWSRHRQARDRLDGPLVRKRSSPATEPHRPQRRSAARMLLTPWARVTCHVCLGGLRSSASKTITHHVQCIINQASVNRARADELELVSPTPASQRNGSAV